MSKITDEIDYLEFVNANFPKSYMNKDEANLKLIFSRINENNLVIGMIITHLEEVPNTYQLEFLKSYHYYFNKLLLVLPTNDEQIINYNIRSIVEELLKFIYSTQVVATEQEIKNLSFRHLKEELMKQQGVTKTEIEKLFSYYATYSNSIHNKSEKSFGVDFLAEILTIHNPRITNLHDILLKIINSFYEVVGEIVNFTYSTLTTGERLLLNHNLNKKRLSKVYEKIFVFNQT